MSRSDRTGRLLEGIRELGRGSHSWRFVRRIVVAAVGGLVLLTGVLMLVLPGPAFVVIPAGLAILALEFRWAARLLREIRRRMAEAGTRITGAPPAAEGGSAVSGGDREESAGRR